MQIVKGYRNSQLRKDEGTHIRKINLQENIAKKLNSDPQSHAPFDGERV